MARQLDEGSDYGRRLVRGDVGALVVRVEVEAPEERLVQHLASPLARLPVHLLGVREQSRQVGEDVAAGVGVEPVGVVELPGDASALVANVAQPLGDFCLWPVSVSHKVEIAVFLGAEPLQLGGEPLAHVRVDRGRRVNGFVHTGRDTGAQVRRERDARVSVEYGLLRAGDRQVRQVARVFLAPLAEVVEVQLSRVALASHDHEALLGPMAPDSALEVVVVVPLPGSPRAACREHVLHFLEKLRGDERGVPPLVLSAVVAHVAEVIAVAQHGAERVDRDRSGGVSTGRTGAQSGIGQCLDQGVEPVGTGRVQLEGHRHQWAALRINGHGSDFTPLELLAHVDVSDRCDAQRAATRDLLAHLVGDVGARGTRLVLVHAVEHGRHQVADRRILGVIHDGDEHGACPAHLAFGDGRVDAVAVQTAARVHDDVVDIVLGLEPGHHLLELRPFVGRGRRPAGLDVFADDLGAEFRGASLDGRALGRKRNAFGVVVGVDLAGR
ncbi:hypothetical protein OG519_11575 [Streptomyces sp. NBC_01190]|nr:hypothetical protein OG519_11575 [Streptomyces sp. NBC_01190]